VIAPPAGTTAGMGSDPTTTTTELKAIQDDRAGAHREQERDAETATEARAHRRRAEKAAYLRDKLAAAERAERED
jgi:hypothetical protein